MRWWMEAATACLEFEEKKRSRKQHHQRRRRWNVVGQCTNRNKSTTCHNGLLLQMGKAEWRLVLNPGWLRKKNTAALHPTECYIEGYLWGDWSDTKTNQQPRAEWKQNECDDPDRGTKRNEIQLHLTFPRKLLKQRPFWLVWWFACSLMPASRLCMLAIFVCLLGKLECNL